jgi:hypothetical protein
MFDPGSFLANGIACAAALGFAAFVRPGRREAVTLAALLCVNYMFCALGYTDASPALALQAIGVPITNKETWMLADACFGAAAVLIAFWRPWAWIFWATSIVQVGIHALRMTEAIDGTTYSDWLEIVLHGQLAVFFVIGGPGVGDRLHDAFDRFRHRRRAPASFSCQDEAAP